MYKLEDHPKWKEIQSFGLPDDSQSLSAFMVYMDLCEGKGWWNVRCHACEELSKVYLSGHASRNKPREIVLPVSVECALSPSDIKKYLKALQLPEYVTHGFTLAVQAGDSSTVYYRISDGLVPPDPLEVTEWKKYRREETPQLQRHHISEQMAPYIQQQQQQQQNNQPVEDSDIVHDNDDT